MYIYIYIYITHINFIILYKLKYARNYTKYTIEHKYSYNNQNIFTNKNKTVEKSKSYNNIQSGLKTIAHESCKFDAWQGFKK